MSAVVENSFQITFFVCSHEKSILYKNMVDPNKFVVGIVAAKKVLLLTIMAATCLFFVVFLLIFYVRVFLSRTLTIHWTAEKGKVPSLFLWTTCMHKLKFRNVLTLLHLRLLLRIFNCSACNYQTNCNTCNYRTAAWNDLSTSEK